MRKMYLFIVYALICINYSCSKDDVQTNSTPTVVIPNIQVVSFNKEFIVNGDELVLTGSNFVSQNQQTKLVFKNILTNQVIEKNVTPISNTEIRFVISDDILIERNSLSVKILQKESNFKDIFVVPKGWYKINTYNQSNANILNSFVFDDTEEVFMNVRFTTSNPNGGSSSTQSLKKLANNSYLGYENVNINGIFTSSFTMLNKSVGAFCNSNNMYSTNDSFKSVLSRNLMGPSSGLRVAIDENYIHYFDVDKFLFYNIWDVGFITDDGGNTYTNIPISNLTTQVYFPNSTTIQSSPRIVYMKKSISNNKYYKIGYRWTKTAIGSPDVFKNFVLESNNGLDNWSVIDDNTIITSISAIRNSKFISINNIYSILNDNLVLSTDYMKSWTTIKPNVKFISLKDENTWYIQENDAIYKTLNAGQSWQFEFNLEPNAVINDISFSNKKVIISGRNGLLYIKHE